MPSRPEMDIPLLDSTAIGNLIPDVLTRPAAEGARIIALKWMHQLVDMRLRWGQFVEPTAGSRAVTDNQTRADVDDYTEILHKSRVALRRLRAVLREHRDELKDVTTPRIDKALRTLGRKTNALRDQDVHIAWLDAETDALDESARREALALRRYLEQASAPGIALVEDAFERYLDPVRDTLMQRLSWYRRREAVGSTMLLDAPYSRTLAARLRNGERKIQRDIERMHLDEQTREHISTEALEEMHDIRLRLKRHRALLAPLTDAHPTLAALYELETRGQDLLGAMRDADLLGQVARNNGCHALSAVLAGVRLSNVSAFLDQWVARGLEVREIFAAAIAWLEDDHSVVEGIAVADTAADLETRAADETSSHQLPMEIERKFLLSGVPPEAVAMPPIVIEQGWIPGTMLRERLRRSTYPDGRVRCTRTIKLGRPEARVEIEEDTGNAIFQAMWALTTSARIRKRRHVVRDHRHTWEIDVFNDRDLVLAEVELAALDEQVTIPSWLEPWILREVTGEAAYLNSQMARPELASDSATQ